MGWIPAPVLIEAQKIKVDLGVNRDAEALNLMAQYARIGREMENIGKYLGFPKMRKK